MNALELRDCCNALEEEVDGKRDGKECMDCCEEAAKNKACNEFCQNFWNSLKQFGEHIINT